MVECRPIVSWKGSLVPVVERTITVDQPLEAVWAFLADFTTTEDWHPPTLYTERTSGDGGVGTTYHNVAKFQGQRTEVAYVVTEYVEHQRLQLRGDASVVELLNTITMAGTPSGGTRVTYQAEFSPHGSATTQPFEPTELVVLGDHVAESLQDSLEHL